MPREPEETDAPESTDASARKGRPTPSRKDAQAANRRPLVAGDRKSATKAARDKERIERNREYAAMKSGDISNFPLRERGPVKAYIRDYVDARWNLGEYFLVTAIVLLIVSVVTAKMTLVALIAMGLVYVYGILAIGDTILMWVQLKKRIKAKFSEQTLAGERSLGLYAASRALQFRRWRMPRPRFDKHGNYPE
ncbi:DUF3043 domain-containing protein [Rarobacter faecitabidus]|uniref:DUF3043 family protein n=1 Tax=Rarobacter faecitabidus TaxID=13243 RepID=A0A542ZVL3_RARFA|nr:DUF3043 domain-containing protein [Rarobacter faecitabidus]TQL64286.1 DUF3043 family protein [Rarobacter faecitabidus]